MFRKFRFSPGAFRITVPWLRNKPFLGLLFTIGAIFFAFLLLPFVLIIMLISSVGRFRLNKDEVESHLSEEIDRLKKLCYTELRKLEKDVEAKQIKGRSGTEYNVEAVGIWDEGCEGGKLRVCVSIDDGGLSSFWPLSRSFIIAPDGSIAKK